MAPAGMNTNDATGSPGGVCNVGGLSRKIAGLDDPTVAHGLVAHDIILILAHAAFSRDNQHARGGRVPGIVSFHVPIALFVTVNWGEAPLYINGTPSLRNRPETTKLFVLGM